MVVLPLLLVGRWTSNEGIEEGVERAFIRGAELGDARATLKLRWWRWTGRRLLAGGFGL